MYSHSGIGLFGYIILFVIIVWVFGGAFNGGGFGPWNNRGNFAGVGVDGYGLGFEDYKAICEGQKAHIAQTATTQYLIEQQANATQNVVKAQTDMLATKIDFYEYQGLRDKVAERDMIISELKNQLFTKDQLAPITAQLSSIQCNMLRRPDVTGVGVACPSAAILNGLGVNSVNNCGSCCSNNVLI